MQTQKYRDRHKTLHHYDVYDDDSKERIAHASVEAPHNADHLSVGWMGKGHRLSDGGQNTLGHARVKDFWRKLAREHPDRKTAIGERISGARRPLDKTGQWRKPKDWDKNYQMKVNLDRLRSTP